MAAQAELDETLLDCIVHDRIQQALARCGKMELSLAGELKDNRTIAFLSVFMACHLISDDLNGARYLWRRAPVEAKSTKNDFSAFWDIGQCLWESNFAGANMLMNSYPFSSELSRLLVDKLRLSIRNTQRVLISQAYTSIAPSLLADHLMMTADELNAEVATLGWTLLEDGFVRPTPIAMTTASGKLPSSEDMMAKIADYVSYFEQKPLKVDTKWNTKLVEESKK